ncbi:MAG TPA: hypothetical protein VEZ72_15340 [Paenibacillus sp.]|nr:hypothetical protein [Paenibacillus sp.]
MNIHLLQWGLFSFMVGLLLSLPLAAVHYQNSPRWTKIFTNPRKLKSAHLDFFTQAFAATLAFALEFAMQREFPAYVAIPLLFGTVCNPFLLLMEATPLIRRGFGKLLYLALRAASPLSLLFAWFYIAGTALPVSMLLLLASFALAGGLLIVYHNRRQEE